MIPIASIVPPLSDAAAGDARLAAGYAIFAAAYLVFAAGKFPGTKIDRAGMAIIGAVLMVALGVVSPRDALSAVDFSTIVLLFSMMVIVAYLHQAGFFDWITELVVNRLHPRHLLPTTIFTCGLLSAFFVNDIICLVMVPFVLAVTRRMGLKPMPYLLAVATASNIGSVASITGNPQNMLVGSYSGISYRHFLGHLGPVAIVGLFLDWLVLRYVAAHGAAEPQLRAEVAHVNVAQLRKPVIVVAAVLAGFLLSVPPALVAAVGAAMMLITRTRDPRKVYQEVDWGLLVFFVGLFVIVRGAENAGLMRLLDEATRQVNLQQPAAFTAVTAILSNVVSNVPAVMLLKSLVPGFANPHTGWLVLAMASTLAGNLTITGSVANLIVVESAKGEVEIGFWDYFKVGLPLTLLTLLVGWAWLVVIR